MWYVLNKNIHLQPNPEDAGDASRPVSIGDVAQLIEKNGADDWYHLGVRRYQLGGYVEGWAKKERVDETDAPPRPELVIPTFLSMCLFAEAEINKEPTSAPYYVLADYLIAIAKMESGLKNIGPRTKNGLGTGPFQLIVTDWQRFLDASGGGFGIDDRESPLAQCFAAARLTHMEIKAFADAIAAYDSARGDTETSGPTGPYVPSLIDVFFARIFGVEAAVACRIHKFEKTDANVRIDELLLEYAPGANDADKAAHVERLMGWYHTFLKSNSIGGVTAGANTVEAAYKGAEDRLGRELKAAFDLIEEHIPEAIPVATGAAAWMAIAETEMEYWKDPNVTEATQLGRDKIREYFATTDYPTAANEPWCGAFAAWCLTQAGMANTVLPGSAAAATWKTWGAVSLSSSTGNIPFGAIVVTAPAPGSARTGHVTFFSGYESGKDRILGLGGNQTNTVNEKSFPVSKIVAVRWPQTAPTANIDITAGVDPRLRPLLQLIGQIEANGNYNAYFAKAGNNSVIFTDMTMSQVKNWQSKRSGLSYSSAVGLYQFISKTLAWVQNTVGIDNNTKFSPETQDMMALFLLKHRGLEKFLSNSMSLEQFGNRLAMEWAALPVLQQVTKSNGVVVNPGTSYYDDDGVNSASATVAGIPTVTRFRTALTDLKNAYI